jgi:hypothetical protein
MRPLLATAAACLALSGCAAAGGVPSTSETPRRDLAARPSYAASAPAPTGAATATAPPGATATSATSGTTASNGGTTNTTNTTNGGTATSAGSTAPYRDFVSLTDPSGDAGVGAPAYVDLRGVTLADTGTMLLATVTLDGFVPRVAEPADTIGIGVDLYPPGTGRESDYQLFADGEPDGWFAYLQTPRGFVHYPGTFAVTGNRLVFTVPLTSVGSPDTGRVSAFADWSRRSSSVTGNPSSNDYAPTLGTTSYSR